MSDTQGLLTPPTIDGVHLRQIDPATVEISDPAVKGNLVMATGAAREQVLYAGPGWPEVTRRHRVELDYRHLGEYQETIERLLAFAGPHDLVLWKHVTLGYRCDGTLSELQLPWRQALHVTPPPPGFPVERYRPKVTVDGAAVAPEDVDALTYAGGSPDDGKAWFAYGGTVLKLATEPAAGVKVVVRMVPALRVVTGAETARRYPEPIREPRKLVFEEV